MDELIKALEASRAAAVEKRNAQLKIAQDNIAGDTPERLAAHNAAMEAAAKIGTDEIELIDSRLVQLRADRDRETRAAALRAGDPGPADGRASGVTVTSEPTVYGKHSGQSYFLDQARVHFRQGQGHGGFAAAEERQQRHEAELRVEMPKREQRAQRTSEQRLEAILTGEVLEGGNRRERRMANLERRAYERFGAMGVPMYEKRIISRTDGQGGYEVPPLWLVDEYIEYVRAGRVLADLWHGFPLPTGTDSINIPRLTTGTATGTQPGDGAPLPGQDIKDSFVHAQIMTIAGQQDAAMQILDQSPLNYDEIIFGDLTADYNMQFSAQLLLGNGFPQLNGMYQAGTLGSSAGASTSGYVTQATGTTTAQWMGAASAYLAAGQLISNISRNRMLPPDAFLANPAVWWALATATDTTGRPLVVPEQQGNNYNPAAAMAGGALTEGLAGRMLSLPLYIDPNVPLTFGGTTAPSIGAISNGHTAPTPGSGSGAVYTPLIAARWRDLFVWEGDIRTRVLQEVLSGSLAVRFQVWAYAASIPNRYQDANNNLVSYGNVNSVGTPGAALSQGTNGGLTGF